MVQININYIASSFILLRFDDCITAYKRMGWYSHILILGAMAFFQLGGRRALRRGLPAKAIPAKEKGKVGEIAKEKEEVKEKEKEKPVRSSSTSSEQSSTGITTPLQPADEKDPHDFQWVKHALQDHEKRHDRGGMGADAGFVDSVMRGAETPGLVGTPGWSREGSPFKSS